MLWFFGCNWFEPRALWFFVRLRFVRIFFVSLHLYETVVLDIELCAQLVLFRFYALWTGLVKRNEHDFLFFVCFVRIFVSTHFYTDLIYVRAFGFFVGLHFVLLFTLCLWSNFSEHFVRFLVSHTLRVNFSLWLITLIFVSIVFGVI